ncbi:MAG: hypothetical protein ACI3XH_01630 [Phascolarctobacterium sp.]
MFLRKLGKRGVAMTEYAILLAFVAAVAGSFTSDNGLASSITDAVGKATNAINLVMGEKKNLLENWVVGKASWNTGNPIKVNDRTGDRLHTDPFAIEPNTEYEIKVDLNKISLGQGNNFQLGFMTADDAGNCIVSSGGIDSGWINLTQTVDKLSSDGYICNYDSATNTATISFTSKENNTQLAMNFRSQNNNNSITAAGVADQLKDAITMTKK